MAAAHYGLSNLICLVDINNQQPDGPSRKVLGFEPLVDKWAAFGWHVQRLDGNDLPAVVAAFDMARSLAEAKPRVILFDTLMGKGVPFLEQREKNHFIRVDPAEWQQAIEVLDRSQPYVQPDGASA
jgi:transketolase